ncbi:MAG TPA: NfeD family protein, partial [Anaerolineales bacterium]|nr:NfeD family protein [Anaerolineales bacterium]
MRSLRDLGRVEFWDIEEFWIKEQTMEVFGSSLICVLGAMLIITMISLTASIRVVQEDARLSVYRLGRYIGDRGPGLVVLIPAIDRGVVKQVGSLQKTLNQELLDAIGETSTTVYTDGRISLSGTEWNAMSRSPISAGQRVRVVRMILEVVKEE